ncbi:hypothetical protein BN2537_6755 [Streptomyces venezuelae]|nr:hypothetical protein BN2537_6755 [Streptomyces venezuelae]
MVPGSARTELLSTAGRRVGRENDPDSLARPFHDIRFHGGDQK